MSKNIKVHAALTTAGLIYGANYVIAKSIMPDYIAAFGLIVIRVACASILFWIFHRIFIKEKIKHTRDYRKFFFLAIFGVGVNMLAFFKGLELTSPVNASIIMTLVPVIVLIGAYFTTKEKITPLKLSGITLGATGAILLITSGDVSLENSRFLGDILIIINATFYGMYLVLVKPIMQRYHAVTVVKWIFILGLFMVTPFGFQDVLAVKWSAIPFNIWFSILFVIFGTTFSTYLLTAWALQHVNSSVAGAYIYLQPVFATLIAYFFANETLNIEKLIFAALIFMGVYLVSKKSQSPVVSPSKKS